MVLKTSLRSDEVRDILPQLDLSIAAHATEAIPQGSGNTASASGKHDLNVKTIAAAIFKHMITASGHTYVTWEPYLHLSRPHARLQRPAIYFTANLTVSALQHEIFSRPEEQYLTSFEALPTNILESLSFGRAQEAPDLYLSESKITSHAPKPSSITDAIKIRGATRRAYPVVPALFTKIRYTTLPDGIIASLHLESSHIIAGSMRICKAEFTVPDAHVEDLTRIDLPLEACGGDETVLLYRVVASNPPHEQSQISVSVRAEVILDQGSCCILEIEWQTQVDLRHAWQRLLYGWSRPATVSSHHKTLSAAQFSPPMDIAPNRDESTEGGVTFIFTRGSIVQASSDFTLSVHCNNRSPRSRRFAVMMAQPRKCQLVKQVIASSEAVSDVDSSVFRTTPLERVKPPDTLDLNPDVKIGPLGPGAAFEAKMFFRALRPGILDVGTLRIVDLDTRQTADVKEIPDIIASILLEQ